MAKKWVSILPVLLFVQFYAFAQGCNCPPIATCGPCAGGYSSFTLRYNGIGAVAVNAFDGGGLIYANLLVPSGHVFTVNGSSGGNFQGNNLRVFIGIFLHVDISTNCGSSVAVNDTYGAFTIIGITSKNGGPLCCEDPVVDNTDPVIVNCPANIQTSLAGACTVPVTWTPPTAWDNCGDLTLSSTHDPNDPFPKGTTTVVYTATDDYGNTSTCSFNVTVTDDTAPIFANCPADVNVNADAGCNAIATWAPPTTSDNCGPVTLTSTHDPNDEFGLGSTVVTYTATDPEGNTSTCSFNVNVVDTTDPVLTGCPTDITMTANAACSANVPWSPPIASDNCGAPVVSSTRMPGDLFSIGTTVVTYTATDGAGNTVACSFNVTIVDDADPVISGCPSNIINSANGSCQALVGWTEPFATDNCAGLTLSSSHLPNTNFPLGTTLVTYTATDGATNVATCTFTVTVVDDTKPVLTSCPADISTGANTSCESEVLWSPPNVSDNCAGATVSSTHDPGDVFPLGTTLVTYTATDAAGNTETCSFNVTVTDDTDPVITGCPVADIVATVDASCKASVSWSVPIASDNCGVVSFSSNVSPGIFDLGTTIVTYTAIDAAGNETTCSFNVVVNDETAPVISGCPPADILAVAGPTCSAIVNWALPTADDNCGSPTLSSNYDPGDLFNLGTTVVTYTATDGAGNVSTCTFNVVVEDNSAPLITSCPGNISVPVDAGCSAAVFWAEPIVNDNCSLSPLIKSHSPGDIFPLGITTVTYTAIDGGGNSSTCSFDVEVTDDVDPVFAGCSGADIIVNATASCQAVATWIEPTATDNCAGVTMVQTHEPGNFFPVGTTLVTYTATDAAGNTATCTFNVVVIDDAAPVFSGCPPSDILVPANSSCQSVASWIAPIAADNCAVINTSSSHPIGSLFSLGTTVVTYTAEDAAGNVTQCSFNVVVKDQTAPQFSGCTSADILAVANAGCEAPVTWSPPVATDNCSGIVVSSTHDPGDVFPLGNTTVTYTAVDGEGSIATCSFNVIVVDNVKPVFAGCIPADIIVSADAACSKAVTWAEPVASDNCGVPAITSTHSPNEVFSIGTTQVVYTATDISGNIATCSFNVVVRDESDPVFSFCPPTQVAEASSNCSATVTWSLPTASDNCGAVTLSSSHSPGANFPLGVTTVVYTAKDAAGNTVQCSFDVVVEDKSAPVFSGCTNIFALADNECDASVIWTPPTVSDCGAATVSSTHNPGDTFPLGTTVVTYTATDGGGNVSTCSFNVVVKDEAKPELHQCPEDIYLEITDECEKVVTWVEPTATDNCSVPTISRTHGPGSIFPLGTSTVTYTATDSFGNIATCQFKVVLVYKGQPVITACPENIQVVGDENGEAFITWSPPSATAACGDVKLTSSHSPSTMFPVGKTTVQYKAEDASGNTAYCEFDVTVIRDMIDIGIGKIITPDGNGQNDEWTVINIEKYQTNKVVVVDRWGSVVFQASGYNNTSVVWNGTNRSGQMAPTGTYFYTLTIRYGSEAIERSGFIELIR